MERSVLSVFWFCWIFTFVDALGLGHVAFHLPLPAPLAVPEAASFPVTSSSHDVSQRGAPARTVRIAVEAGGASPYTKPSQDRTMAVDGRFRYPVDGRDVEAAVPAQTAFTLSSSSKHFSDGDGVEAAVRPQTKELSQDRTVAGDVRFFYPVDGTEAAVRPQTAFTLSSSSSTNVSDDDDVDAPVSPQTEELSQDRTMAGGVRFLYPVDGDGAEAAVSAHTAFTLSSSSTHVSTSSLQSRYLPPKLVCTEFPAQFGWGSNREKCESGNGNKGGTQYVYNEGRGTSNAACGKDASCWCCKYESKVRVLTNNTNAPPINIRIMATSVAPNTPWWLQYGGVYLVFIGLGFTALAMIVCVVVLRW